MKKIMIATLLFPLGLFGTTKKSFSDGFFVQAAPTLYANKAAPPFFGGVLNLGYRFQDFDLSLRSKALVDRSDSQKARTFTTSMLNIEYRYPLFNVPLFLIGGVSLGVAAHEIRVLEGDGSTSYREKVGFYGELTFGTLYPLSQNVSALVRLSGAFAQLPKSSTEVVDYSGVGVEIGFEYSVGNTIPLRY